jgi:hypothetical protein
MAKLSVGKCASCGWPWSDHDGVALLCKRLQKVRKALISLRVMAGEGAVDGLSANMLLGRIVEVCDQTLEATE